VGDDRYGEATDVKRMTKLYDFSRLALHAASLELVLPGSGSRLHMAASTPAIFERLT